MEIYDNFLMQGKQEWKKGTNKFFKLSFEWNLKKIVWEKCCMENATINYTYSEFSASLAEFSNKMEIREFHNNNFKDHARTHENFTQYGW